MKETKVWDNLGNCEPGSFHPRNLVWEGKDTTIEKNWCVFCCVLNWWTEEKGIQVAVLKVVAWTEMSLPRLSGLSLICPETPHCCDRSERIPRLKAVLFPEVNANATQSQSNQPRSLKLQLQRASQFRSAHDAEITDPQPFLPPSTVVEYEITNQWCNLNTLQQC